MERQVFDERGDFTEIYLHRIGTDSFGHRIGNFYVIFAGFTHNQAGVRGTCDRTAFMEPLIFETETSNNGISSVYEYDNYGRLAKERNNVPDSK